MPIQYAGGTNVNTTFSNSGSATRREIVDGVVTALTSAGWSTISGSGTGDVLMESATTSQGLKMRVRVLDPGSGTCAQLKVRNASNVLAMSNALFLRPENSKTWRVIANRYQAFIFVPATSTVARDFCGFGVPYIPDQFASKIYDCIWAWGDSNSDTDSSVRACFRKVLAANGNFSTASLFFVVNGGSWENRNGANQANSAQGLPSLVFPQASAGQNVGSTTGYRWHNDEALMLEPLLAFGATSALDEAKVRGQLWDAVISTESYAKDATVTFDGLNWWNLTDANVGISRNTSRGSLFVVAP